MSNKFEDNIKENIAKPSEIESDVVTKNDTFNDALPYRKFQLTKKPSNKVDRQAFNVYMERDLVKRLDRVCKKSDYKRNELINMMCEWALDNLEFKD